MGSRWASARHCHAALKTLLERLRLRHSGGHRNLSPTRPYRVDEDESEDAVGAPPSYPKSTMPSEEPQSNKRRRTNGDLGAYTQHHSYSQRQSLPLGVDMFEPQNWQPVLEYTGPDFGFDADQLAERGEWQGLLNQNLNGESGGLFDGAGWDAYLQSFGERLNY